MAKSKRTNWLDRRIAAPGPYLALCLSPEEFDRALSEIDCDTPHPWVGNSWSHATTHMLENLAGDAVCIVCLSGWQFRDPVEVAGLIVHESVHVWQHYAARIGEHAPSAEQEAYAIQSIAQELMAEFARRAASFAELIDARSR